VSDISDLMHALANPEEKSRIGKSQEGIFGRNDKNYSEQKQKDETKIKPQRF
jgi:hypothetical protein